MPKEYFKIENKSGYDPVFIQYVEGWDLDAAPGIPVVVTQYPPKVEENAK